MLFPSVHKAEGSILTNWNGLAIFGTDWVQVKLLCKTWRGWYLHRNITSCRPTVHLVLTDMCEYSYASNLKVSDN